MSSGFSIIRINAGNLSKPANTLIQCISRAIGGLYEPKGIVRRAKAEAKAKLIEVEGDIAASELQQRAARRLILQETLYQQNSEKIISDAVPQLEDAARPEEVSNDWYINFYDKARLISDERMQTLWSEILAGEANTPGKFSRRTVNFVQSMDKSEADLFTKLCGFNIFFGDGFIPLVFENTNDLYQRNGVNFGKLTLLDSIGLINFAGLTGFVLRGQKGKLSFSYYDKNYAMEVGGRSDGEIGIGKVILTRIGEELATLGGSEPVSGFEEYMMKNWQQYSPTLLD